MAASLALEEEQGTYAGFQRRHNGYYAGDFSAGGNATDGTAPRQPHLPGSLLSGLSGRP